MLQYLARVWNRFLDNSPAFQHRDFRLYWGGRLFSQVGTQMQNIAINWHIFELLQGESLVVELFGRTVTLGADALGLGTVGLVRVIPIVIFALVGGLMADAIDRRKLMMVTQSVSAVIAAVLAIMTLLGRVEVWLLYATTAGLASANAFDSPAAQSLVPNLVPRKHFTSAVSLNALMFQMASVVGPGLAGLLIAGFEIGVVYSINALSFIAVIVSLLLMKYRGKPAVSTQGLGWSALIDGVKFTFRTRLIWSTMLLDFFATLFSGARTMLPIVATDVLGMGATGYGILATAQPAGAIIAGIYMATRREIKRHGVVLLTGVAVYGLATALFGLSTVVALSYFFFALTGAGDTVSTVIRGTLRQLATPDSMRGRMTSVNMVFFMGGPQLGELEAGLVAALYGAPFAIVTGGIATVLLTAVVAWYYPDLRNYDGSMPVPEENMGLS